MAVLTQEAKAKLVDYKDAIFAVHPNDETTEEGQPKYTDAQWIDKVVERYLIGEIKRGNRILHEGQYIEPAVVIN